VKAIGRPEQVEEAYAALAERFPTDAGVWMKLGDSRFAADKDVLALDAYRHAATAGSGETDAHRAVAFVEEILRLDPSRRGLSVRERARRWDEILNRVLLAVSACGSSAGIESATSLLKKRAASLEASDQKMDAALRIWKSTAASCKSDPVLGHILSKLQPESQKAPSPSQP
jgi:hypothetical protein